MKSTDERLHEGMADPKYPVGGREDKISFLRSYAGCTREYAEKFYDDWWARQEVPTMSSGYEGYVSSDPLEDAELKNALYHVKPSDVSPHTVFTKSHRYMKYKIVEDLYTPDVLAKKVNALDFLQAEGQKIDAINPSHYTQGDIECIDAMEACSTDEEFIGHLRLTALKYLWRLNEKGDPVENARKAQWYVERLIAKLEAIEETRSDLDSI